MSQDHKKYQRKPVEPVFKPAEDVEHVEAQTKKTEDEFIAKRQEVDRIMERTALESVVPVISKSPWSLLTQDQQTGKNYLVAKTQEEEGTLAYWRRTRVMLHSRWTVSGKWTSPDSHGDPEFHSGLLQGDRVNGFCSPDQVATGKKYKVKLQCRNCAHVYKRTLKSLSDKDPPCPICKKSITKSGGLADIIKHQKMAGPSGSNMTRAIDITAEITMQDHGLTDLKDNIRAGESMAPRLAPALQAQADNMFSGAKRKIPNTSFNPAQLGKQALAGAFRGGGPDPMNAVQPKFTRRVDILNKTGGNA